MDHKKHQTSVNDEQYTIVDQKTTTDHLSASPKNLDELNEILDRISKPKIYQQLRVGLQLAINKFEHFVRLAGRDGQFNFYTDLLPVLCNWACDFACMTEISLPKLHLRAGVEGDSTLTARQILHILANAFFLNLKHPSMTFSIIYDTRTPTAIERILCFLSYFYQISKESSFNPDHKVVFKRFRLTKSPDWTNMKKKFNNSIVRLHSEPMERSDAEYFVDFANRDIHIGTIIPSLTQEEVLFSCCPEAFPSMMLCDILEDDEIVIIDGTRRFSNYTGYLSTFQFTGFHQPNEIVNILVIDAVMMDHFTKDSIIRDINKAYLSFSKCKGKKITTGHWGCGAFGGEKSSKFLQQLCAAAAAEVKLDYSTFKDEKWRTQLDNVLNLVIKNDWSVAQVVTAMIKYRKEAPGEDFYDYIVGILK